MNTLPIPIQNNHLFLAITEDKERRGLTELIAQLAVKGTYYFIAGGQWVPDQDDLRIAIGRYTTSVNEVLDNPRLTRPTTCFQLVDLLANIDSKNDPLLILDFFHLFYNPDVDISHRMYLLKQCIQHLERIKLSRPVVVFIKQASRDEYDLFFPMIAAIADETVELKRDSLLEALLPESLMGRDLKSSRALAEKLVAKLHKIGALIPNDRLIIKQFGEWILEESVAIANAAGLSPMEAALTVISLYEHKRINKLADDMEGWMRELEKRIDESIPVNE